MKLALNENTIPQTDLFAFISLAAEAGFSAVELNIRKVEEALLCYPSKRIIKHLHDCGVSVLSVNCLNPYYAPVENRNFLEKQCEFISCLCEYISCPAILIPAGIWIDSVGDKPSWRNSYDLQKENLLFMAGIFDRAGIAIAIEPVGGKMFSFTKLKQADELIQDCGLDTLGIVPDIHLQVCAGDKPEDLKAIKSPITLMHLDDTLHKPGKELDIQLDRAFPGEGIARCDEWITAALDTGFFGYFSLELFSQALSALPAKEAVTLCYKKATEFSDSYYKMVGIRGHT